MFVKSVRSRPVQSGPASGAAPPPTLSRTDDTPPSPPQNGHRAHASLPPGPGPGPALSEFVRVADPVPGGAAGGERPGGGGGGGRGRSPGAGHAPRGSHIEAPPTLLVPQQIVRGAALGGAAAGAAAASGGRRRLVTGPEIGRSRLTGQGVHPGRYLRPGETRGRDVSLHCGNMEKKQPIWAGLGWAGPDWTGLDCHCHCGCGDMTLCSA